MGSGPVALLVHGTGASTHSWAALAPLLARRFTVIAPDLPGHGFTERPAFERLSLPGMAAALAALLSTLDAVPAFAVGHSAGAAILARLCLDGRIAPVRLFSLNGSLLPLPGMRHPALAPLTRLVICNEVLPRVLAWKARDGSAMRDLLRKTGSSLDRIGADFYQRLARFPRHVGAALGMMAHWDVRSLTHELPRLAVPLTLVAGSGDAMIPPSASEQVAAMVRGAQAVLLPGLGHLAHEECPAEIAALILTAVERDFAAVDHPLSG